MYNLRVLLKFINIVRKFSLRLTQKIHLKEHSDSKVRTKQKEIYSTLFFQNAEKT